VPSSHAIRVSADIEAPQAAVWRRVSDHEDTPSWVGAAKSVTLAQSGTPRNGLGAVRVVRFKPALWTTIHERITRFEPPHAFDYVLFKGMPALVSHLGRISVDDLGGGGSRLNWDVDFVFRTVHPFRLFLPSFLREFEAVLQTAVADLKSQLERGSESAEHP
jgi:uncharacterized protein YndB with AHSA1/START domain